MLRPYVLGHAGQDAQEEANRGVEPTAAEQAAMPTLVHQAEGAHYKKHKQWQWDQNEPR
jgi:hypothetical protein